jgi:hypothetical protein
MRVSGGVGVRGVWSGSQSFSTREETENWLNIIKYQISNASNKDETFSRIVNSECSHSMQQSAFVE